MIPVGFFVFHWVFIWKVKNIFSVLSSVWNIQTGFPLKPMFSEGPSFFAIFVCIEGKLILSPKMEALPKTVTVSWVVKTTYRLNMSGLDFLDLVLQSSDSFILIAAFQFCFSFFSVYEVQIELLPMWCSGSLVLFFCQDWFFWFFFWSEIKRFLFSWKPYFRKVLFFVLFVGNYGALNLHLPVVALSESVTMSGPARTLLNLNMSRLQFLILVLQVFNSFDLISLFFHVLFSLIFTVYGVYVHLLLAESLCSTICLFKIECHFSVFFCSTLQGVFLLRPMFSGSLSFLHFFCNVDTGWVPWCGFHQKPANFLNLFFFGACFYFLCFFVADCAPARWWPCERQDVVLGQLRLNRRWTGWIAWCGFLQETGFVPRNVFYFLVRFWSLFLVFLLFWGRFCTCSLVASRVSRRCTWPAETK